jgi:glycosyltransferase involved in cell wall biosynthesis
MLSIIIPTLNEEKYLFNLLESVRKQGVKGYEVILSDAGSTDKTIETAKQHGCVITKGGLPSKGRNEGAKVAKGETLLFLDADTVLPDGFLKQVMEEIEEKKIEIATFPIIFYPTNGFDKAISKVYNFITWLTKDFLAHAAGGVLLASKRIHEKIGGFNEDIILAEDYDYARRAHKLVRFHYIETQPVGYSNRRFKKEGYVKSCIKYILIEFYLLFFGPIKSDIFNYKFAHYDDKKNKKIKKK